MQRSSPIPDLTVYQMRVQITGACGTASAACDLFRPDHDEERGARLHDADRIDIYRGAAVLCRPRAPAAKRSAICRSSNRPNI